jgi:hypothetical protein
MSIKNLLILGFISGILEIPASLMDAKKPLMRQISCITENFQGQNSIRIELNKRCIK